MCHHADAEDRLEVSNAEEAHEREFEEAPRAGLEAELDREKFVALGVLM